MMVGERAIAQPKQDVVIDILFKVVCILGLLSTMMWSCYQYIKNEDACEVIFKKFQQDDKSFYPEIRIGFPHQINESALKLAFGRDDMTRSKFRDIVQGADWDDKILGTEFDKFNIKLDDSMIAYCI